MPPRFTFIVIIILYIGLVQVYESLFEMFILRNVITRLPEFMFGMYFVNRKKEVNIYEFLYTLLITIFLFAQPVNINVMYRITIMGICSFIVLVYIAKYIQKSKVLIMICNKVSAFSYAIFLVHHLVIDILNRRLYGYTLTTIEVFSQFLMAVALILCLAYLLKHLTNKLMDLFFML